MSSRGERPPGAEPRGFAEEFLAKGDIQVTEAVLEQRLWW
jgi:hypothetical protein